MGAFDDLIPAQNNPPPGVFDDLVPQRQPDVDFGSPLSVTAQRELNPQQQQELLEARQNVRSVFGSTRAPDEIQSEPVRQENLLAEFRANAPKGTKFARDLPEIGAAPELGSLNLDAVKNSLAANLINSDVELASALKNNIPGAKVVQDPEGNPVIKMPSGGEFAINKPGLSGQDFVKFATRFLAFAPSSRIVGTGARQLTRGAGATAATEAGLQGAEAAVGGEFDPVDVALTGAISPVAQLGAERVVGPAAERIVNSVRDIGSRRLLEETAPSIQALRGSAREIYSQIDESGATIDPNVVTGFVRSLQQRLNREGLDPQLTPAANRLVQRFGEEAGEPLTVSRLDTLRQIAQDVAGSNEARDARLGVIAINAVDDLIEDLGPASLVQGQADNIGGRTVSQAFRDARDLWGRARRAEVLENAISLAENTASGFENGLRIEFRKIIRQIKRGRLRGFTPEERRAIEVVEQGTTFSNLVKQVGKLGVPEDQATNTLILTLIGGAGAVGGLSGAGTAAAITIPTVLRRHARQLTEGNARLASAITRSNNNARGVIGAYMRATPRGQRNPADLGALLHNAGHELPEATGTRLIDDAIFIAKSAAKAQSAQED